MIRDTSFIAKAVPQQETPLNQMLAKHSPSSGMATWGISLGPLGQLPQYENRQQCAASDTMFDLPSR
jgi:hypothetical protein